jgi:hypothetical protein
MRRRGLHRRSPVTAGLGSAVSASRLCALTLETKLAQFPNLIRSRTTPTLDNPYPVDVHWAETANGAFSDPAFKAAAVLEMNVVVNSAARLGVEVLRDNSSSPNSFLMLGNSLAQLRNLVRSRTTLLLNDPEPINLRDP